MHSEIEILNMEIFFTQISWPKWNLDVNKADKGQNVLYIYIHISGKLVSPYHGSSAELV